MTRLGFDPPISRLISECSTTELYQSVTEVLRLLEWDSILNRCKRLLLQDKQLLQPSREEKSEEVRRYRTKKKAGAKERDGAARQQAGRRISVKVNDR